MKTWMLFFLLCAKYVDCTEMDFPPLPQGQPYALQSEEDKWKLDGLSNIANGIALTLRNQPPYELMGNILSKSFGKGGKSPSISEVIDYEVPMIVLASFSLLAALIIPIVGLVFCCCRCKGNCGGTIDENQLKQHPTKERIAYSTGILLCAFFLILSGSFILASSVQMKNSIPHARTVWNDSFGDIGLYTSNTLKELSHIVVQEAVPTIGILLNDVIAMGRDIAVPIIQEGSPVFEELFSSVKDVDKAVSQSLYLLDEIHTTVSSLVSKTSDIQLKLTTVQRNLTNIRDECKGNGGGNVCNDIPVGNELATEANFTKVPNVTDTQKKVKDVAKTNLTDEVVKGNESLHNMPEEVQNLTTNLTNQFQNFSSKIDNMPKDVLKPLEDDINKYLADTLSPIRDDVDEKYLGPDGMLTKYDKYRHVIFILIGTLCMLDGLLLIIAVVMGLCGSTSYDTPNSRSNIADWGGRLLIGAAGLFFFSAFLINLLTGIIFLLGTNIAIVCDDVPNYKLLEKTIDDPKVMGEYILGQMLLKDGDIPLTMSGVLGDCSRNHAPWNVLKMDHLFNLSDVLNYKDQIPSLNEVFVELNKTVEDTPVISEEAKTSVNDSLNAGVQEINYTQFQEQVNKPIVSVPLPSFASNVTKAANAANNAGQGAVGSKLTDTANRLEHIHTTAVKPTEKQAENLGKLTSALEQQGNAIVNSVERVLVSLKEVETFLTTDALSIAARGVTKHWNTVFGDVDFLLDHAIYQVRFEVGRCKTLSNIYQGLTGSVCVHYAAGMNASWVAFGLCALFLLISIIICVKASKHFLRTSSSGVNDEPEPEEMLELPWMDQRTLPKQNLL